MEGEHGAGGDQNGGLRLGTTAVARQPDRFVTVGEHAAAVDQHRGGAAEGELLRCFGVSTFR